MLKKLGVDDETKFTPNSIKTEHDPKSMSFQICIIKATNVLPAGMCSPYVVLDHQNEELERTNTIYKNLNPVYNERFMIKLPHGKIFFIQRYIT